MTKIAEIRTPRLRLRPLCDGDAPDLARLIGEWEVVRMLAHPPYPYTIEAAQTYLATAQERPWEFAIVGDRFMGVIGITDHLGYWLGKPYWSQGFMAEAARALVGSYFAHTQSPSISSGAFADNPRSQAVLRKLGFRVTGQSRLFVPSRGEDVDHVDMALDRANWTDDMDGSLDVTHHQSD